MTHKKPHPAQRPEESPVYVQELGSVLAVYPDGTKDLISFSSPSSMRASMMRHRATHFRGPFAQFAMGTYGTIASRNDLNRNAAKTPAYFWCL
jgi:hypothetical protein